MKQKTKAPATIHPLKINAKEWNKQVVMNILCQRIGNSSDSLRDILKQDYNGIKLPNAQTIMEWLYSADESAQKFGEQYARAKEQQMEYLAEEMLEIANKARLGKKTTKKANGQTEVVTGDMVERAKLQIETRKWLMGKLKPKKYGDKITLHGDPDAPIELKISQMISSADELIKKIRGPQD